MPFPFWPERPRKPSRPCRRCRPQVEVLSERLLPSFTPAAPVAVGVIPIAVAVRDFNGDGKQDLGVANLSSGTVSIRLGNGTGAFTAAPDVAVGSGPISVAVGDFNGDGKKDLAVANKNDNAVCILLGTGDGTFTKVTHEIGRAS